MRGGAPLAIVNSLVVGALLVPATGCERPVPQEQPARAEQANSRESGKTAPAGGITLEEDARIPPGPPGTVRVARLHVVEWNGTRDDTILGYEVYRRCPSGDWERIGFVKLRDDDERNRGKYLFRDRFDVRCEYTIAAVGADGKPGPKTVDIQ